MTQGINGPNGFKVGSEVFKDIDNNLTTTREVKSNSIFTTTQNSNNGHLVKQIKEYDKDGDGKIDYKEVTEYTPGLMDTSGNKYGKGVTEIDADGDGKIDYKSETTRYNNKPNEKITYIDYNGDGRYDTVVGTELESRQIMEKVDVDNDGNVDYFRSDLHDK